MACNNVKISDFHRGDTKVYKFTFVDSLNQPVDITGWVFWMTLKSDIAYIDANAELQVNATMPSDANSVGGIGYLTLESTDTDTLTPGKYYYDIQRVIPGTPPNVTTMFSGKVRILEDVTRSVV